MSLTADHIGRALDIVARDVPSAKSKSQLPLDPNRQHSQVRDAWATLAELDPVLNDYLTILAELDGSSLKPKRGNETYAQYYERVKDELDSEPHADRWDQGIRRGLVVSLPDEIAKEIAAELRAHGVPGRGKGAAGSGSGSPPPTVKIGV